MSGQLPLVLLHPLGSDRSFWDEIRTELTEQPVIAIDLLGHGAAAACPPGATMDDFAEAVIDQLRHSGALPAGGRFNVAGISLGGLVAQHLAASYRDSVDRLVLIDTVGTYSEEFRASWRQRAHLARTEGLDGLFPPMATMWFTEAYQDRRPDSVAKVRQHFLATSAEGYARSCEALEFANTNELAPSILAPTLIVCGTEDAPIFVEATTALADAIPDARVHWLAGGKHAAILEQPAQFAAAVNKFLG